VRPLQFSPQSLWNIFRQRPSADHAAICPRVHRERYHVSTKLRGGTDWDCVII
jgi:hypothetical protein